jgi:hypothetical protein
MYKQAHMANCTKNVFAIATSERIEAKIMETKQEHIRVRVSQMYGEGEMQITPNGIKFSNAWCDKLYNTEEEFRSKIILDINELVGEEWHVMFTPFLTGEYFADIYALTESDAIQIYNIIQNKITNFKFKFYYKGIINSLLRTH